MRANLIVQFANEISGCGLWVSDMAQGLACQRTCLHEEIKEANTNVKKVQEKNIAARSANTPRTTRYDDYTPQQWCDLVSLLPRISVSRLQDSLLPTIGHQMLL